VFCALPHGASLPWVKRAREAGARVVDLSSDLPSRPRNGQAVYGMPELRSGPSGALLREEIRTADIVANPGCYPTSILLALAPLVRAGVVAPGATVIANSASGVTGSGEHPKREYLFAEVSDDYRAYGVGNTHRHLKEMTATLGTLGADADLVFTPHLLPGRARHPVDDHDPAHRAAGRSAGDLPRCVCRRAVHRDRRAAADAARRRAAQRRTHRGNDDRGDAHAPRCSSRRRSTTS
jgi:hypothetical protein